MMRVKLNNFNFNFNTSLLMILGCGLINLLSRIELKPAIFLAIICLKCQQKSLGFRKNQQDAKRAIENLTKSKQ